MVMPSLIATDSQLNTSATGDQASERVVQLTNGTALVYWMVAGSATPLQGRIVGATGAAVGSDIVFSGVGAGATVSVGELPGGAFVIASRIGTAIRVEKFDASGVSAGIVNLVSSEAVTGGPIVETTTSGVIGIYVKTVSQAQVGAFDANLNLTVPFGTLMLNNGTASAATDADGSIWTLIDGAGIGTGGFGFVSTRGTGAATVIQLHVIDLVSQTDVSGPITIASGATVDVASFRMVEMPNGNLLASWIDGTTVRAQVYSPTGATAGAAIAQPATAPTGASASGLADGGVLLLWSDIVAGTRDVRGETFTAAGASASAVFTVNAVAAGAQTNPSAAVLGGGDIVVAWDNANGAAIDVFDRLLSFTRPDAVADSFVVTSGTTTALALTANDADPNGRALSVQGISGATSANIAFAGGVVTYAAPAGFVGTDSFTYTLVNAAGGTDTVVATVNVQAPAGAAPVLRIDPADGAAGVSVVADVALLFSGAVTRGTGVIVLARADGAVVESFDAATSTRITLSGNRLVVNPTAALAPGTGYTLAIPAAALSVGGTPFAGLTGYDFTTSATSIADVSQYFLVMPSGSVALAQGSGDVFGDAGKQQVTIANTPGKIVLDGSFNRGGDVIQLAGAASDYSVVRSGSSVLLNDGDSIVQLPVGLVGADVQFADRLLTLKFTTAQATAIGLGDQIVTTAAAQVTAAGGAATATGAVDASLVSQLIVTSGGRATASGVLQVFGGIGTSETVRAAGSAIEFDGSFNSGGDVMILGGRASDYSAVRTGSTMVLSGAGQTVAIPVGVAGATVRFADGDRALAFERLAGGGVGAIKLGDQSIGTSAVAVTAVTTVAGSLDQDSDGNLATVFGIDASAANIRFTDADATAQNVRLIGFGRGDNVTLTGAAASYYFSSSGTDITISHIGGDDKLSTTVFAGVADPTIFVNSEASAEAAAGFDFVTFAV